MDNIKRLYAVDLPFFEEIKDRFNIDQKVFDSRGKRWAKCNFCSAILPKNAFLGTIDLNRSVCIICFHKNVERVKL